jgi:hypothetical protein
MNLENIKLSEKGQIQKATYCITLLIQNVQNGQVHTNRKEIGGYKGLGRRKNEK